VLVEKDKVHLKSETKYKLTKEKYLSLYYFNTILLEISPWCCVPGWFKHGLQEIDLHTLTPFLYKYRERLIKHGLFYAVSDYTDVGIVPDCL
jgi:hypothetical protein